MASVETADGNFDVCNADGTVAYTTELAMVDNVASFKLKGNLNFVQSEFYKLCDWVNKEDGGLFSEQGSIYSIYLDLIIDGRCSRQTFCVMVNFERKCIEVEYDYGGKRVPFSTTQMPMSFVNMKHLQQTLAFWTHFIDFVAAISE